MGVLTKKMFGSNGVKSCSFRQNKHTESIAKAIQLPHQPKQGEICNHYFGALINKEQLELPLPLIVILFCVES